MSKENLPLDVYCFHCGEKFLKSGHEGFEECSHCEKGFDDLCDQAQFAVKQVMKTWIEHLK